MAATERLLKEMILGKDYETIKAQNSPGTIYRTFPKWQEYAQELYEKTQENIRLAKKREVEATKKAEIAEQNEQERQIRIKTLQKREEIITDHISELDQQANAAAENTARMTQEENRVHIRLKKLAERGLTEENLDPLLNSDIQSPPELMERIQTKTQFLEIRDEIILIVEQVDLTTQQLEKEKTKLLEIQEKTRSAQNELDQFNTENLLNQEALSVVRRCFKLGFTASILVGLLNALLRLSIKNEILASSQRLVKGLEKVKTIVDLEEAVIRISSQLKALKRDLAETQGILNAKKNNVLSSISIVENRANQSIENAAIKAVDMTKQVTNAVKNVETQSITSINNLEKETEDRLSAHEQAISFFFIKNSHTLQLMIDTIGVQITEYGDLREDMGQMKPWMNLASILYGTYQDPQQLLNVNLRVVRSIIQGIHTYVLARWPSERIGVPREISDKDFGLLTGSEINLVSASTLLLMGLMKLEMEGKV